MNPLLLLGISSLLMGGFQAFNSASANSQAQTLSQQQQRQQAGLLKQQEEERSNSQIQIGQNAETAKAAATKAMMGPDAAGFGQSLMQPVGNALTPGARGAGGKSLFGM